MQNYFKEQRDVFALAQAVLFLIISQSPHAQAACFELGGHYQALTVFAGIHQEEREVRTQAAAILGTLLASQVMDDAPFLVLNWRGIDSFSPWSSLMSPL